MPGTGGRMSSTSDSVPTHNGSAATRSALSISASPRRRAALPDRNAFASAATARRAPAPRRLTEYSLSHAAVGGAARDVLLRQQRPQLIERRAAARPDPDGGGGLLGRLDRRGEILDRDSPPRRRVAGPSSTPTPVRSPPRKPVRGWRSPCSCGEIHARVERFRCHGTMCRPSTPGACCASAARLLVVERATGRAFNPGDRRGGTRAGPDRARSADPDRCVAVSPSLSSRAISCRSSESPNSTGTGPPALRSAAPSTSAALRVRLASSTDLPAATASSANAARVWVLPASGRPAHDRDPRAAGVLDRALLAVAQRQRRADRLVVLGPASAAAPYSAANAVPSTSFLTPSRTERAVLGLHDGLAGVQPRSPSPRRARCRRSASWGRPARSARSRTRPAGASR